MEDSDKAKKGYDHQFLEEPPQELRCGICLAVARQPQQHGECGKLFCKNCLTLHSILAIECPNCDLELTTFHDGKSEQEIKQLKVRCDSFKDGCQWTGELRSLHQHIRNCDYTTVSCPNFCEKPSYKLLQRDLATHLEVCPARTHQCPHCNIMGPYQELTTSHLETCPKVEVACPYPECNRTMQRCQLDKHKVTCQDLHPCKYANIGCPAQLRRGELQAHEEDDKLHLQITKKKLVELTETLESRERRFREHNEQVYTAILELRYTLEALVQPITPTVFAVTNFSQRRRRGEIVFSPSFYLRAEGPYVHLTVFTNGRDSAQNSYLSVFVCIDIGEYDSTLSWPFTGTVGVELLNQLEDRNHHKKLIKFAGKDEVGWRPEEGREQCGFGYNKFIFNTYLNLEMVKNCQYLKGDKLYFRVSEQFVAF